MVVRQSVAFADYQSPSSSVAAAGLAAGGHTRTSDDLGCERRSLPACRTVGSTSFANLLGNSFELAEDFCKRRDNKCDNYLKKSYTKSINSNFVKKIP